MDKALASGAGDCGFESHRDRVLLVLFFSRLFCFEVMHDHGPLRAKDRATDPNSSPARLLCFNGNTEAAPDTRLFASNR